MNHGTAPAPVTPPPRAATSRLRVRYSECDPMGVAHHGSYATWLELARTDLLRSSGLTYAQCEQRGFYLVITNLQINYRRAVRYDDILDVHVEVVDAGRVKLQHQYKIILVERTPGTPGSIQSAHSEVGEVLATASTTLACITTAGRLQALPDLFRLSTSP